MEENDPKVKELLHVAKRLEGMTRHASVHAAGVVIAPRAITEYAPLYTGARDEITTQWSMKEIERIGLLKMDFLGLSTLTLIFDALAEIKRTTGIDVDIDNVPFDESGHVPAVSGRADLRRLPVRKQRDAGHPPEGQAGEARRSDRAERPLSSRPAAERHGGRLHRPQTGKTPVRLQGFHNSNRSWPTPTASSPIRNR